MPAASGCGEAGPNAAKTASKARSKKKAAEKVRGEYDKEVPPAGGVIDIDIDIDVKASSAVQSKAAAATTESDPGAK